MRLLAIDSATPVAGVAILEDDKLLREAFANLGKTHSETLLPLVDRVLRECNLTLPEMDGVAVTGGPGSFTGLRIGLALAKGLCLGAHLPLIAVSTLEVLAANLPFNTAVICPLLDARKQEVYAGFFTTATGEPVALAEPGAFSPQEFVEKARQLSREQGKEKLILLGDGVLPYRDFFADELGEQMNLASPHLMLPRASALASLAKKKMAAGELADVVNLHPQYIRLSEAEYRLGKGATEC